MTIHVKGRVNVYRSGNRVSSAETNLTGLIEVSISDTSDIQTLASQWMDLETSAKPAYFLTWGWVQTWLKQLPDTVKPRVLSAKYNNEVVGLALIVNSAQSRKPLFLSSGMLVVNETGDPYYDLLTIEYNDFLVKQAYRDEVITACLEYLDKQITGWDEILISAIASGSPLTDPGFSRRFKLNLKMQQKLPSWYVNLKKIRQEGKPYLDSLSKNTRYQIRRTLRECEKHGDLEFLTATSKEEALDYLSRLSEWHRIYWNSKGQSGCFENDFLLEFHQTLIQDRFDHGEIQLVCLRLGTSELGYLYNFVKDGCVYFYQSGFNYGISRKLKPGLIAHYKTIEHNMEYGMSIYNFLASDDQYKRSLSTDKDELLWISLQKDKLKFRIENKFNEMLENGKEILRHGRNSYRKSGR